MRKTILSIVILAFFIIVAVGSGSSSSTINSSNSSRSSWDAYSTPVKPSSGLCHICGGRGYTLSNGVKEKCNICNGSGKAVSFPEPK